VPAGGLVDLQAFPEQFSKLRDDTKPGDCNPPAFSSVSHGRGICASCNKQSQQNKRVSMMKPCKLLVLWLCPVLVLLVGPVATCVVANPIAISEYVSEYETDTGTALLRVPVHIAFGPGEVEVISEVGLGGRLLYRNNPTEAFQVSPIDVNGPHSVVYNPADQLYYVNDTDNNRMIAFSDPSSNVIAAERTGLAGITLNRPHDVVIDPGTNLIYAINPSAPQVFQFPELGFQFENLLLDLTNLSTDSTYSRALTFTDGKLYVVGSAAGQVIEVTDLTTGAFVVHDSFGKKVNAFSGSWETTGLVLNDIEFFDGHWYVTSFFSSASADGTDPNENKLIRFEDWDDFANGTWEDISDLLPNDVVPYYLTPGPDGLYLAAFNGVTPGQGQDKIYLISSNIPEPTSLVLTLFGAVALAAYRNRPRRQ